MSARKIYLISILVGSAAGVVAVLFFLSIHHLSQLFFEHWANFPLVQAGGEIDLTTPLLVGAPHRWIMFLLPIVGGLGVGLCAHFFHAEATGGGTEIFLDAFHARGGVLKKRTAFVKFLASVCTLSTGGSGGKEGPMTLIGAGVGSLCGRVLQLGARAQRTLLLAGAAGGLGAILRAPLGGAITAVEILYKEDFESDALIPCIISSVTAYTVYTTILGYGRVFTVHVNVAHTVTQFFLFVFLALLCSLCGYCFVVVFHWMKRAVFDRLPVHPIFLPAIGGFFLSVLCLFFPSLLRSGLGVIQQALDGHFTATSWQLTCGLFLLLAFLKMLAVGFTIQSGGSAGTLIPSLFIGAMLGGCIGTAGHELFPTAVPDVNVFIIVGMASFFAAVTNASLGALVIVCELTGSYELLPPLMVVSVIALIFTHRWSLYRHQVTNKFSSRAHAWEMQPKGMP